MKRITRFLCSVILPVVLSCLTNAQTPASPPSDLSAFRSLYRELVETNTTYSAGDCTRAAKQLESRFREGGFTESELTPYVPPDRPRDGGLVVTWNGRNPTIPAILLLAHIDVVEAKREDWVRDPFKLVEEDGYFYGRGASDDKAQAAIFADTLIRLRHARFRPNRTLKLALTCGEETSNPDVLNGAGWLVDHRPDLLKAGFALNEGGAGRGGPAGMPIYLGLGVGEKSPRNFVGPIEKIAAIHFPGVPVIPEMSTGASDATHLGRIGIPTYGVPGLWNEPETAGTHGLNERISVNSVYLGRDYLFDLIRYFAGS